MDHMCYSAESLDKPHPPAVTGTYLDQMSEIFRWHHKGILFTITRAFTEGIMCVWGEGVIWGFILLVLNYKVLITTCKMTSALRKDLM